MRMADYHDIMWSRHKGHKDIVQDANEGAALVLAAADDRLAGITGY